MGYPSRPMDYIKGEVLFFDKDLNWTSFDLVQRVRNSICRELGIKKLKVGHAGTLDPLATGLMILCSGKSTSLIESFQDAEKEYVAELKIGATTPSFDMETDEDNKSDFSYVTAELIEVVANRFTGVIEQEPPVFSAIKVNGKRAFHFARQGQEVDIKPRKVNIRKISVTIFEPPKIEIVVICSKGTYIRSLARDIGRALDCGAYLTGLRRVRIGDYRVDNAWKVNDFLNYLQNKETN